MSRCMHCGGDDHGTNQCPDMPPPVIPTDAQAVGMPDNLEILARALEVQLHSHSPLFLTSVTVREIIAGLRSVAARPPAATVETATKSAPVFLPPRNTGERLPSSDAAGAGAGTFPRWCPGCSRDVDGVCSYFQCAVGPNGLDAQLRLSAQAAQLPELPAPAVAYADHSYPAYSKRQMQEYGQACALASQPSPAAPIEAASEGYAGWQGGDNALEKAGRSHNGSSADIEDPDFVMSVEVQTEFEKGWAAGQTAIRSICEDAAQHALANELEIEALKARVEDLKRRITTEPQAAPYTLSKKVHDVAADCENAAIVLQGQTYQVSAERLAGAYERIAASLRTALSLSRPQHSSESASGASTHDQSRS